jgi:glycerate kinase
MKVVVAVDSFKGSMTSMEAGMAVKAGILAAKKDAEVIVKPLADGGEGTTDALIEGLKGERVDVTVTGPYHEPVQAYYGYLRESNTAVMEMATAAGITLSDKKEPMTATTYGVGELILHAIGRGIRNFIIGIGGSATNDGGVGMLRAFGYKFLDEKGEDVGEGGQALARIASVEISDKKELLSQCNFRIACDVTNPLCGSQGATYIYGPQKGVTPDILPVLDAGMKNYAEVTAKVIGQDNQNVAGAGAAGVLGAIGYDGKLAVQSPEVLTRLYDIATIVPAILLALIFVVLTFGYKLSKEQLEGCRCGCDRGRSSGSSDCHGKSPGGRCEAWQEIWRKNHCICRKRYERGSCLQ